MVVNPTTITAITPAHAAGAVDVTVTVAAQTSATSGADTFTYIAPPPPPPPPVSLPPTSRALLPKPGPLHTASFAIAGADAYHAQWVTQGAYPSAAPGEIAEWVVAFRNIGFAGWYRGLLGASAALGSSQPLDNDSSERAGMDPGNWQYPNRLAVQATDYVGPGQTGWFVIQVRAPRVPGVYRIYIRPVIDSVVWMEDYGAFFDLTVVAPAMASSLRETESQTRPVDRPLPSYNDEDRATRGQGEAGLQR